MPLQHVESPQLFAVRSESTPELVWNARLILEQEEGYSELETRLVGNLPGHFLLISMPLRGWEGFIRQYGTVWLRYIDERLLRFSSQVLRILNDPMPLAFLSYPNEVQVIQRRRHKRMKVYFRTFISTDQNIESTLVQQGVMLNISTGGCLLMADLTPQFGQQIWLRFQLPWTSEEFSLKGKVVRCDTSKAGVHCGIEFVELQGDQSSRLAKLMRALEKGI